MIDVRLILWEGISLSDVQNLNIFKAVHTFIQECGRIDIYINQI